jgi:hypothetical protein
MERLPPGVFALAAIGDNLMSGGGLQNGASPRRCHDR